MMFIYSAAYMLGLIQTQGAHSVHEPASPQAFRVDRLGNAMYVTAAIVFVLVVAALLWSAFRRRSAEEPRDPERMNRSMSMTVIAATAVTTVVLFVFLVLDLSVGRALTTNPG